LGRSFDRERLFARLDSHAAAPGIWIAGPPGMGKTTLVATYLQARAVSCVWLQLDASDADPATFVHFLLAAAGQVLQGRGPRLTPPTADDLRDVPAYLRRCFRRLASVLELPWALVLDNAQALGATSVVHAGLAAALAELPDRARLIAISREPPPPAYARGLAGQQLVLVDERELRFDDNESTRLVALHGRAWPGADLRLATDGWAAAMILLLATRSELGPDAALRSGTARARLFEFFASEVLAGMSPADAMALVRIAHLPSATVAMAVAVSGHAHAGDLLAGLTQRSLFTERRDGNPPAYTFHALFSEFLRSRAADEMSPTELQALRVDAARLLAAHGDADAAIALLIDAGAWSEAFGLITEHAGRLVAQGRTALLREWILALPEGVRSGADASYWLGCCVLASDPAQALHHLECAHRGYLMLEDVAAGAWGSFCTAAAAADAIIFIGANLHALDPWMPLLLNRTDAYLAQRDPLIDLRVLPGLLAAFVHRETDHPLTAALAERAERLLDQPVGASQRILLGTLAYYLLWTGQTSRLDRIIVKIDRMCGSSDAAPGTLLRWYGVSVMIRALLGRVDESLLHARQALALVGPGPSAMRVKAHLLLVLAAIAGRDAGLARTHLAESAGQLDAGNAIDSTTYEFQRGLLMLLDADWTGAEQLMRAAVASGQASGWPLREHIAMLGQTLAATQCGRFEEAEAVLQAVHAHRFHTVCRWHHWLADLIEAHLARCRGDTARALVALRRAFEGGRDGGFDFGPMPFCCGDMMPRLAALALEHDIDPPFALHVIRRHALPAPPGAGERWPWPIRIRTLGGFAIERDSAPAPAVRKESRKPLELLKLLIAYGSGSAGAPVPVEALCAALWPDAEGDAARNSFDNTLHRLRKLLGHERHVTLHAGGLSLEAATCWTDAIALQACMAEADMSAFEGDPKHILALAERALALYGGAFLAGEDELPLVQAARARIDTRFTRMLAGAGANLEAAGQPADAARLYARVLEVQPLAEDTCRRLMSCLLGLGQRAEAYDAYRRLRHQMSVLLSLHPGPETQALASSIRDL
jgi:ATP/maltotriose-dependent transcriptional regulator MalT/DNA-binding SARP family transcriptional activator